MLYFAFLLSISSVLGFLGVRATNVVVGAQGSTSALSMVTH
jgi:hypothetical protein